MSIWVTVLMSSLANAARINGTLSGFAGHLYMLPENRCWKLEWGVFIDG
jgi:hypothetical protein